MHMSLPWRAPRVYSGRRAGRWMNAVIWLLVGGMVLPPSLLAQTLTNPVIPSSPSGSSVSPSISNQLSPFLPFGNYGLPTPPGQAIVTNPTATQPIVPQHAPCPTPTAPDLSPENTVPNLNDYWPMAANSLLPTSVEQRMRQEEEERDRQLERLQAEKENVAWSCRVRWSGKRRVFLSSTGCNRRCRGQWAACRGSFKLSSINKNSR